MLGRYYAFGTKPFSILNTIIILFYNLKGLFAFTIGGRPTCSQLKSLSPWLSWFLEPELLSLPDILSGRCEINNTLQSACVLKRRRVSKDSWNSRYSSARRCVKRVTKPRAFV